MAQLRWDMVEAPRLDTRDLALAGQTISSGFDRFADLLRQRDLRLNKQATDAGAAQLLAAQTPEELAAARAQAAGVDPTGRRDTRALLEMANQRQGQITDQALDASNLALNQNKQAVAEATTRFADPIRQAYALASQGDHAGVDALLKRIAAQGGTAAIPAVTEALMKQFGDYRDFTETKRLHDSQIANDGVRTAAAQETLSLARQDHRDKLDGFRLGDEFARRPDILTQSTKDGEADLIRSDRFKAASPSAQQAALAQYRAIHEPLVTPTDAVLASQAGMLGRVDSAQDAIKAEQARIDNQYKTDAAKAIAAASKYSTDEETTPTMLGPLAYGKNRDVFASTSRQLFDKARTEGVKIKVDDEERTIVPTAADIRAAIEFTPSVKGSWGAEADFNEVVLAKAAMYKYARDQGQGQNTALDIKRDKAFSSMIDSRITQLKDAQLRRLTTGQGADPGIATELARLTETPLEELRREYKAAQQPNKKGTARITWTK